MTNMDAATDWVVSQGRYALDLDGSNDLIDLPANAVSFSGDFSYCGWWYFRAASVQVFYVRNSTGASLIYLTSATVIRVRSEVFGDVGFTVPSVLNRWVFVAVTRTAGSMRLFLNGVESASGALSNPGAFFFDRIGRSYTGGGSGGGFDGLLDDHAFYSRPMKESEIAMRYASGNGRGIAYTPRRRRKAYSFGPSFNAAWARGSNQFIQPSLIGVA
jgi:hypothetical protein